MKARLALLTAVALALIAGAAAAHAGTRPPSAADQYVEQIPTASGGSASGKAKKAKVAEPVQRQIARSGGSDAQALTKVASSAPTQSTRAAKPRAKSTTQPKTKPRKATSADTRVSFGKSASTAAQTVGSASDSRVLGLGIALVVAALVSVGVALARQRRRGRA